MPSIASPVGDSGNGFQEKDWDREAVEGDSGQWLCEPTVMEVFQTLTASVAAKPRLVLVFKQPPGHPWMFLTSPTGRIMDHPLLSAAGMGEVNDAKLQKFQ